MTDNYNIYYNKLMGMKKADIIREGQTWDIWANCQSTTAWLMKQSKTWLAGVLAGRLCRLENRGY